MACELILEPVWNKRLCTYICWQSFSTNKKLVFEFQTSNVFILSVWTFFEIFKVKMKRDFFFIWWKSKVYFHMYNSNYLLWDTFILPINLLINSNHFNYCSLVSCYVPCEAWYGFTETFFSSQLQTRTNSSRAG